MHVIHVGNGVVMTVEDCFEILAAARRANLKRQLTELASGEKLDLRNLTSEEKENRKRENSAFGAVFRLVTLALWPGPTYWGLIKWPMEDFATVSSMYALPFNRVRIDLLIGKWKTILSNDVQFRSYRKSVGNFCD